VNMVITMKAKNSCRKGCVIFAVHISSDKGKFKVEDADVFVEFLYRSSSFDAM